MPLAAAPVQGIGAPMAVSVYTSTTSLPFTASAPGTAILQLIGSGTVATLTLVVNSTTTTVSLNAGNALSSGALYEFGINLLAGDEVYSVSGATLFRLIYVYPLS